MVEELSEQVVEVFDRFNIEKVHNHRKGVCVQGLEEDGCK